MRSLKLYSRRPAIIETDFALHASASRSTHRSFTVALGGATKAMSTIHDSQDDQKSLINRVPEERLQAIQSLLNLYI